MIIAEQLEKVLGTKVIIEKIDYSLTGSFVLKGIQFFIEPEPDQDSQPDLRIDEISVLFHPSSLWKKGLKIYSIEILNPKLKIVELRREKYNWSRLSMIEKLLEENSKKRIKEKSAGNSGFFLKNLDIQKIFIKDLDLVLNAPSIAPNKQNYLLSVGLGFYENQFTLYIKFKQKKESSLELSVKFIIPGKLAYLIKNHEKIKADLIANGFPNGKVNLLFKDFNFSPIKQLIRQLMNKNLVIVSADGEATLMKDQDHRDTFKVKFNKLLLNFGDSLKFLSAQIDGGLRYNVQQEEIKGKSLKIKLDPDQNINIREISLDTKGLHTLNARVDLRVETIAKYLNPDVSVKGHTIGKVRFDRSKENIEARLNFNNISFSHNKIPFLENSNFTLRIQNNQVSVPKSNVVFFKNPMALAAQGSFSTKKGIDLKYNIYGNRLDLGLVLNTLNGSPKSFGKTHEEEKESKGSDRRKKNTYPMKIRGDVHFRETLVSKIKFDDFKASLNFKNEKITLYPFRLSLGQGNLIGRYELTLKKTPRHQFSFQVKRLKINKLIDFFDVEDKVYASFNGSLKGVMHGTDFKSLTRSLKATLDLKTSTGKLVNTFLQGGLLNGPLGPLEKKLRHLEFSEFSADVKALKGKIYVEKANLSNPALQLNVTGKFDWNLVGDGYMKLKFTNDFIEDIAVPARLSILDHYYNGWYQLPFSCIQENIRKLSCWEPDW